MVQSQIIHPNIQVTQITREFRNAASKLPSSKLIKDESFTLFEAVSALEIGDPKMDSGCSAFDPEPEEEFDPARPTSAEETIWLMDELMYREVAWHMGYPLSQTLFTSIHIERLVWPEPKRLTDATFGRDASGVESMSPLLHEVLQPYCLGLIKCCDIVLSMITNQHYYEEEDFATQIFNRPLLHGFSVGEIRDLLPVACAWLDHSNLPSHLVRALKSRIDARSALLKLFYEGTSGERPSAAALEHHLALIKMIEDSAFLGRPTSTAAFTFKIQRRLASSVPPRPMVVVEKDKAFPFLRRLVTDTITAFELLDTSSGGDLFVAYQQFNAQTPQPAAYVRALLQSFLSINEAVLGRISIRDFITADIRSLVLPTESLFDHDQMDDIPEDQQIRLGSRVDLFVDRCGQSFLSLYRTMCLNRCRVRRTMCHAALEWDQIQAEAEQLDTMAISMLNESAIPYATDDEPTNAYSFSSWVHHYKLIQLRTVLRTGFELSIYASYEHALIYWYLAFLSNTHLNHLERISFFVASEKHASTSRQAEIRRTLKHLYRHFSWLKATEAMAKALHRVFTVLQRHGHFPKPAFAYASNELRYELRMRPFLHLSIPEPVDERLVQQSSTMQGVSDEDALEQASRLIQIARKAWDGLLKGGWCFTAPQPPVRQTDATQGGETKHATSVVEREWTQDVRNSMKACIGTGIVVTLLIKLLNGSSHASATGIANAKVEIPPVGSRERWHTNWPVPKIEG